MDKSNILIIDDDHQISEGVRTRLRAAGYDTIAAHNGAAGIESAHSNHPDAIVLDVRMPIMDGLAALKKLKENPDTQRIPVVMLSASIVDQDAALDGGAKYFIRKPFVGSSLIDAVDAVTNRQTIRERK